MTSPSLDADLVAVIEVWEQVHLPATAARMGEIARRFARRVELAGVTSFSDVTGDHVHGFVTAPGRGGRAPAVATSRFRRTAVRGLYRQLRLLGRPVGDPTLDVTVAVRPHGYARPLTDAEIRLCRAVASTHSMTARGASKRAVAWAFAETGATTGEIPQIRLCDLDHPLAPTTVSLPGTRDLVARTVRLTGWGVTTLAGHLVEHCYEPQQRITYSGHGGKTGSNSALSRTCQQIVEVLNAAGVNRDTTVKPASIRHWAGRNAYNDGATLDQVANMLGIASLDTTAARIGLDWTTTPVILKADR